MGDITATVLNPLLGRYEIQERLGIGGMARVYQGWDKNLERTVAIKVLHEHLSHDPTFKQRFEREAKLVASLNHPNIVQVYDFDAVEHEGHPIYYMVMPFISGKSLEDVLEETRKSGQNLSLERVSEILFNLTDALGYAHERGMVHRDVKPGNILFNEQNQAVLTDFGIAKLAAESRNLTQEGLTMGTPAYMSPEQAVGGTVDFRTDIYALGVVLYEMLTGRQPYEDDGNLSILLKHLNAPIPIVSAAVPTDNPYLDRIIFRAMAKAPEDRYQTAQALADDLKAILAGKSPVLPPAYTKPLPPLEINLPSQPTPTDTPAVPTQRSPLGIFAVGITIIAVLLFVGLLGQRMMGTSTPTSTPADEGVEAMTGDLYFTSTFSSDDRFNAYWPQQDNSVLSRQISSDGYYQLSSRVDGRATTSIFDPAYTYENITISMEAALADDSSPASAYGIVFRYVDENNYYVFAVDGLGRYSIWLREDGSWKELRGLDETWTPHEAIQPIGETNTLTLDVIDHEFIGSVNGEMVTHIDDTTIALGNVGIYMATPDSGSASLDVDLYQLLEAVNPVESMTGESE